MLLAEILCILLFCGTLTNTLLLKLYCFCSLVAGDVAGKYDQLFKRVRTVNKKAGPFEVRGGSGAATDL